MNCPTCSSIEVKEIMKLYDDRYGYPGEFTLFRCHSCGHSLLDCDMEYGEIGKLYTDYYPRKSLNIANFKPHVEENGFFYWFDGLASSTFRWVPKNVRVLDVGCGFGESLGYHTARGCEVYGVEVDENIRRVIEKFNYKVHVGLFDDKLYEKNYFDYVTMDQVIEHVSDPILTLRGVTMVLKPGGIAILSTPNARGWGATVFGRRWINWHSPYHLHFFTQDSMQLAAHQAGLELMQVKTVTNSNWLLYQWIHLATYPRLGQSSWFWSPNKKGATPLQKIAVKFISIIHRTKINHLVTRIFDGLSIGDNFIFILKKPE